MKCNYVDMRVRCERQNVGFEPLVLEYIGRYYGDICKFLESLCKLADIKEYLPPGQIWQALRIHLFIDL